MYSVFAPEGITLLASSRVRSFIDSMNTFDVSAECRTTRDNEPSLMRPTICATLSSGTSLFLVCDHQTSTSQWLMVSSDRPLSGSLRLTDFTERFGRVRRYSAMWSPMELV